MSYVERLVINNETTATILYDEHIIRYQLVAPLVKNKKVLDIACGSGYGSVFLADNQAVSVLGIDLDQLAIEQAKASYSRDNLEFKTGDATKLDLADESFDVITSFETIEHLPEVETYLDELKRLVKEDGLVFISTPNVTLFKQLNPWHIKEYTKEEFVSLMKRFFPFVQIIEQKNALTSMIKVNNDKEGIILLNDQTIEAQYFLAVCSKQDKKLKLDNVSSVNTLAYERWENNLGWRLVNWIYKILQKLKIK